MFPKHQQKVSLPPKLHFNTMFVSQRLFLPLPTVSSIYSMKHAVLSNTFEALLKKSLKQMGSPMFIYE